MSIDIHTTLEQLDRAQRALVWNRDHQEAVETLRRVIDQAKRVLNNQPERQTDWQVRHASRPLQGAIVLAEGPLRGHEPAP
jgi:hypothetical protein